MMSMVLGMALLLAAGTPSAFTSHPSGSVRDQYGTQAGSQTPHHLAAEATREFVHQLLQRTRRSYQSNGAHGGGQIVYYNQLPYHQTFTIWKPPVYQISRPYFIPIYGAPGRVPIYYPPQPLLINPGVPRDNPHINYLPAKMPSTPGPTYLPPVEHTTKMTLPPRYDDHFEDQPIWDVVEDTSVTTPESQVIPTRRPPRPKTTHPPVIHGGPSVGAAAAAQGGQSAAAQRTTEQTPTTTTTTRPQQTSPKTANPTNCVWAIISCCSSESDISYECFEQRGCVGAFWDRSPCESDFAKAAISNVLNYYKSK